MDTIGSLSLEWADGCTKPVVLLSYLTLEKSVSLFNKMEQHCTYIISTLYCFFISFMLLLYVSVIFGFMC